MYSPSRCGGDKDGETPAWLSTKRQRTTEVPMQKGDEIMVEVHFCKELPDIQLLGIQDPYVRAYPVPSKRSSSRTRYINDGGTCRATYLVDWLLSLTVFSA